MVTFEAGVFAVDEPCSFTPPNTHALWPWGDLAQPQGLLQPLCLF